VTTNRLFGFVPEPRLDIQAHAGAAFGALVRLSERIELDPTLKHLVDIRASQLNGCAFCLDMHWQEAKGHGIPELKLAQVPAWRESPCFDARERAALDLTEAVTRLADGPVTDDVWDRAATAFDADELAQLLFRITVINAWNRLQATTLATPPSWAGAQAAA
jgi:AhpD family alkylhydroperoxidase